MHHQPGGKSWFDKSSRDDLYRGFKARAWCIRFKARQLLTQGSARAVCCGISSVVCASAITPGPSPDSGASNSPTGAKIQRPRSFQDFGHEARRVTDGILLFNCAVFALQWLSKDVLTFWCAKVNALIAAGQWWRLITPVFLHSSVLHLLINSHALHSIGPQLELTAGGQRFMAVYATSAFTGTLASYIFTPSPSVGASGALFGVGAALAVFYWRHKEVLKEYSDTMLRSLGITLAINVAYSLFFKNIDNWGHIGGALGGAAVGYLLGPNMVRNEQGRFVDKPPVPWLAYPEGARISVNARRQAPTKRLPNRESIDKISQQNDTQPASKDSSTSTSAGPHGTPPVGGSSSAETQSVNRHDHVRQQGLVSGLAGSSLNTGTSTRLTTSSSTGSSQVGIVGAAGLSGGEDLPKFPEPVGMSHQRWLRTWIVQERLRSQGYDV